jgi:hypothetical protein
VVNSPTLHRFFSVHFCLPFILAGLSLIHIALLHKEGSNNPIGSDSGIDDVPFYPYAFVKDLFVFTVFLFLSHGFVGLVGLFRKERFSFPCRWTMSKVYLLHIEISFFRVLNFSRSNMMVYRFSIHSNTKFSIHYGGPFNNDILPGFIRLYFIFN